MTYTEQTIEVRTGKTTKALRRAWVSEDELFAIHYTYDETMWPSLGFTVTHVPSGYTLSSGHGCRRDAEYVAAVWRALDMPWSKKKGGITRASIKLPEVWRRWIAAMRAEIVNPPVLQRDVIKAKRKAAKP